MKSHDYHVLFQQILPISMRHKMTKEYQTTIIQICKIFKFICNKVYDPTTYFLLKFGSTTTLCQLEKVMPPCFFDLMTHLVIHLIEELDICGLVHSHWMYPIEHAMKDLKGYVQNLCKLKGCMVERYIFDEVLGLCTKHMQRFQATRRRG